MYSFFELLSISESASDEEIQRGLAQYLRDCGPADDPFMQMAVSVLRSSKQRALYRRLLEAARVRKAISADLRVMEQGEGWGFSFVRAPEKPASVIVVFSDETLPEPAKEEPKKEYPTDFLFHFAHVLGFGRAHLKMIALVGGLLLLGGGLLAGIPRARAFALERGLKSDLEEGREVLEELRAATKELSESQGRLKLRDDLLQQAASLYPTVKDAVSALNRESLPGEDLLFEKEALLLRVRERLESGQASSKDAEVLAAVISWGKASLSEIDGHLSSLEHVEAMMEMVEFQGSSLSKEESR